MKERILVVDDEDNIVKLVTFNLVKEGFETMAAYDGNQAWEMIARNQPDLVVLDRMLPGIDGFSLLKQLRQQGQNLPVIMLTARGEELDRVLGLELGCDDYVSKPFSPRELVARVKAVLRRVKERSEAAGAEITIDNLSINFEQYEVRISGRVLSLTPKEYELLAFMVKNRGRVLSRELLLDRVWDYAYEGDTRIVDVHISHLREKIEKDPKNPVFIKTVRGVGYRFA
ncbi:MAG: response regulator transcription factor [Syntrophomonadaceae bacterium]|nr:response regulator transcription factor [Syntrophomonadaceae bacterium]